MNFKELEKEIMQITCPKQIIGKSVLGQNIYAFHVGDNSKNQIIIEGGIHAREWVSSLLVLELLKFYLKQDFSKLTHYGGIYFIPLCNPDGALLAMNGIENKIFDEKKEFLKQIIKNYRLNKKNIYNPHNMDLEDNAIGKARDMRTGRSLFPRAAKNILRFCRLSTLASGNIKKASVNDCLASHPSTPNNKNTQEFFEGEDLEPEASCEERSISSFIRSLWKANANAVDLNVNFDALWGNGKSNVFFPAPLNYVGKEPNSEPEVKALIDFTLQVKPMMTISYHTKGEVIFYGFEKLSKNEIERDKKIAKKIAIITGYKIEKTKQSVGGYSDWVSQTFHVPAFTIELGSDDLTHPLTEELLPILFKQNKNIPKLALKLITTNDYSKLN